MSTGHAMDLCSAFVLLLNDPYTVETTANVTRINMETRDQYNGRTKRLRAASKKESAFGYVSNEVLDGRLFLVTNKGKRIRRYKKLAETN